MIENKDLFDDKLFDKEIKDALKLAVSLESLEEEFKKILKTSKVISDVDTFKQYDKLSKLRQDISKMESALKGLAELEITRKKLVEDTKGLTEQYSKELKSLTKTNEALIRQGKAVVKNEKDTNIAYTKSANQLKVNINRIETLVNTMKALESLQKGNTTQVLASIDTYRKQEDQIREVATSINKLSEDFTDVSQTIDRTGDTDTFDTLEDGFENVRDSTRKTTDEVKDFGKSLEETGEKANDSAEAINEYSKSITDSTSDLNDASKAAEDNAKSTEEALRQWTKAQQQAQEYADALSDLKERQAELQEIKGQEGFLDDNSLRELAQVTEEIDKVQGALIDAKNASDGFRDSIAEGGDEAKTTGDNAQDAGEKAERSFKGAEEQVKDTTDALKRQERQLDKLVDSAKGYGNALKINVVDRLFSIASSIGGKALEARAFTVPFDEFVKEFGGNVKDFINSISDFINATSFTVKDPTGKIIVDDKLKEDLQDKFNEIDAINLKIKERLGVTITGNTIEEQIKLLDKYKNAVEAVGGVMSKTDALNFFMGEGLGEAQSRALFEQFPSTRDFGKRFAREYVENAKRDVRFASEDLKKLEEATEGYERLRVTPFGKVTGKARKRSAEELSILEIQFAVDGLTRVVNTSRVEFEKLITAADDSSQSITNRIEKTREAQKNLNQLYRDENSLATNRLKLAQKQVQLSGKTTLTGEALFTAITGRGGDLDAELAGNLSQAEADAFVQAFIEVDAAKLDRRSRLREILQTRRELLSDNLELELDALLDNADKIKSINESIVNDEDKVLAEREIALKKVEKVITTSYDAQIKALVKFNEQARKEVEDANADFAGSDLTVPEAVTEKQINDLIGLDIVELSEAVENLGLSEILSTRILEIVRDRQQNQADLAQLQLDFQFARQNVSFTKQDIEEQKEYLALLEKQNKELGTLQSNFKKSADGSRDALKKGITEVEEANEEFRDKQLELDIEQAEKRLELIKSLGLDTLDAQKTLNELLLEQQRRLVDKQKQLDDEEIKAERDKIETKRELTQKSLDVLTALNEKFANDRIARIDRELSQLQQRQQFLTGLAEAGSNQLQENFAFEQRKIAELELERQRVDENRARRQLAIASFEVFSTRLGTELELQQNAAKDPNKEYIGNPRVNALLKTATDTAVLQSLIQALPAFYEGTEDTGSGGELDSKKGFLSILHPHERVLTAEQNKPLQGLSNREVVERVKSNNVEQKLDELIKVTKTKPSYLGGDYDEMRKTFTERIEQDRKLTRKHYRTDSLF